MNDEIPNFKKSNRNLSGIACVVPVILGMFVGGIIAPLIGLGVGIALYFATKSKS